MYNTNITDATVTTAGIQGCCEATASLPTGKGQAVC